MIAAVRGTDANWFLIVCGDFNARAGMDLKRPSATYGPHTWGGINGNTELPQDLLDGVESYNKRIHRTWLDYRQIPLRGILREFTVLC